MSEIIERVASAIELAEVGYHLRLTSLVDEVSTYTLSYDDDTPDLTFEWIDDACAHIASKKRQAAARLAIEAMREPTEGMIVAGGEAIFACKPTRALEPSHAQAAWPAMIDEALKKNAELSTADSSHHRSATGDQP